MCDPRGTRPCYSLRYALGRGTRCLLLGSCADAGSAVCAQNRDWNLCGKASSSGSSWTKVVACLSCPRLNHREHCALRAPLTIPSPLRSAEAGKGMGCERPSRPASALAGRTVWAWPFKAPVDQRQAFAPSGYWRSSRPLESQNLSRHAQFCRGHGLARCLAAVLRPCWMLFGGRWRSAHLIASDLGYGCAFGSVQSSEKLEGCGLERPPPQASTNRHSLGCSWFRVLEERNPSALC